MCRPPADPLPCALDVPSLQPVPAPACTPGKALCDTWPAPSLPSGTPAAAGGAPCGGTTSIPLQQPHNPMLVFTPGIGTAIRTIMTCIDICVFMITMQRITTEASGAQFAQRKKTKRAETQPEQASTATLYSRYKAGDGALHDQHAKQLVDLIAWHIGVMDARWYVKSRSTCWFEEYMFNIYTPDMFYDILRMRRRTFDRLVHDLRPFIQGQHTHWREPVSVEKKVVVTLFKLMHGVSIPLVADKAALGKSTVHDILRQVCTAISNHFGHLITWPAGRRLTRIAGAFQSK